MQGTLFTTPDEIYALADVDGWNIFWIRPQTVEERIRTLAIIKDVDVKLDLPNRLVIRVVERQPVAAWQAGDQLFLVDAEGVLFEVRGDPSNAVLVRDVRNEPLRPGDRVDPEAIVTALELNQIMPERREFEWRPGAGLSFVTEEGWRVQIGDHQNLMLKVLIYRQFQVQVAPARNVTLLDLSVPERPYYRVASGEE
ncbi:MAG: FtsQ-type POTRA domain-containing protein [Ardenticatenia bacterium]|nr:FtsQ-type POTRA domain-containing protein [Ardenticatenia bacterium]